jgi:hypothetical protein
MFGMQLTRADVRSADDVERAIEVVPGKELEFVKWHRFPRSGGNRWRSTYDSLVAAHYFTKLSHVTRRFCDCLSR